MEQFERRLVRYMDAGFPILYVDTAEDEKAIERIQKVFKGRGMIEWNIRGLFDSSTHSILLEGSLSDDLELLLSDENNLRRKVLILRNVHYYLDQPEIIERLRLLAQRINSGEIEDCTVIFTSPVVRVPIELECYLSIVPMDFLRPGEIRSLIEGFVDEYGLPKLNDDFLDELVLMLKGLSETEIYNVLSLSVADDGEINHSDLELIFEQKQQSIKKSGILDMIPLKENLDDIGGLENLKKWLRRKAEVFKNITKARNFGVDVPKGVLIAGMPGCGKSLNAKAAAKLFGVPLLRMDMGRLMGKYVGESEGNMRRAISLVEASAPCVLWIDELEKAFAGIGSSGGGGEVTTRLFGNFLTWLQEKDSMAFVVATANNIADLPPELMRKGRFDEIFYVGLPNEDERRKIFSIHIGKRRAQDLPKIDLKKLVERTNGYSGADIEGVVKDSIEDAFASKKTELTTDDILRAIDNTQSMSEIMKDSLEKMKKIYEERKFKNASL